MPGNPVHLVGRFFDYLTAPSLTRVERYLVEIWATSEEQALFFAQGRPDQRHGYEAALTIVGRRLPGEAVRAALLHDVGKRHASLGAVGRSVASVLMILGLPLTRRMALYRDHGRIGSEELAGIDSPDLVVDFARDHHETRPGSIDEVTWAALQAADGPPKAGAMLKRPLSWLTK